MSSKVSPIAPGARPGHSRSMEAYPAGMTVAATDPGATLGFGLDACAAKVAGASVTASRTQSNFMDNRIRVCPLECWHRRLKR